MQRSSGRCVRAADLAKAPRPGCALSGPRPEPPAAFFPRCRCACAQDAGRRVLGAGRCPPARGPGVTRGRGAARTRRPGAGCRCRRQGTHVSPTCRPCHLPGLPPRPPAPARAHPGGARAPRGTTYPVIGTAATAASAPACAVAAGGGRLAGKDPLQGRNARAQSRLAGGAGATLRGGRGLRPRAPHAPHRRQRATRRARLQPQL